MAYEQDLENLIKDMKMSGVLKSKNVEKAIRQVPRHLFVPENYKNFAYRDVPLSIEYGQTISQPSTVVIMTELLDVKRNQKILEVGAGSGWQAAILSKLVGKRGFVYTIDRVAELVEFAKSNIKQLKLTNVKVLEGDGSLGVKEYAPFDRIIVTAACPDVPPPLLEQLKDKGKMVIPIGDIYVQEMTVIKKDKKRIEKTSHGTFMFVPLIGKYGFKE